MNSSKSNSRNIRNSKDEKISENGKNIYIDDNYINKERKKHLTVFIIGEEDEIIINSKLLKKYKKKNFDIVKLIPVQISLQGNNFLKKKLKNEYILKLNESKKVELIEKQKIKITETLKYNDNELNDLGYKKAFKYDKRTFCQYYLSLLFTKHILFQIFNKKDYNAYSIKVLVLFFNFSSCYAINALFFK